jgi:hypothetical protein
LNHDRHYIPHGSVVRNNWHREKGRDNFLLTVNRAAAFICGDITALEFGSSDPKDNYLHVGNNPNKKRTTTRKAQRKEEAERSKAQQKEAIRKAQQKRKAKETMVEVAAKKQQEEAETKTTSTPHLNRYMISYYKEEEKQNATERNLVNITNITSTNTSWSDVEHSQFEQGLIAYGWGNWAAIANVNIPTHDRDQVKSRAYRMKRNHPADYQRLIGEHAAYLACTPNVAV